jgi:hypothetical protein
MMCIKISRENYAYDYNYVYSFTLHALCIISCCPRADQILPKSADQACCSWRCYTKALLPLLNPSVNYVCVFRDLYVVRNVSLLSSEYLPCDSTDNSINILPAN